MRRRTTDGDARFRRALGSTLRERRLELLISQGDLAETVDVTQSSISNYETGRSEAPLSILLRLCDALDIHPTDLMQRVTSREALESPTRTAIAS